MLKYRGVNCNLWQVFLKIHAGYVQNEIVTVLPHFHRYMIFGLLLARLARAMVKAVTYHPGGPGSIPVETKSLFSFDLKNSFEGLLIR